MAAFFKGSTLSIYASFKDAEGVVVIPDTVTVIMNYTDTSGAEVTTGPHAMTVSGVRFFYDWASSLASVGNVQYRVTGTSGDRISVAGGSFNLVDL